MAGFFATLPLTSAHAVDARDYGAANGDPDMMAIMDATMDLYPLTQGWFLLEISKWDEVLYDLRGDAPTAAIRRVIALADATGRRLVLERLALNLRAREVMGFCDDVLGRYLVRNRGPTSRDAKATCIRASRDLQRRIKALDVKWDRTGKQFSASFSKARRRANDAEQDLHRARKGTDLRDAPVTLHARYGGGGDYQSASAAPNSRRDSVMLTAS